MNDIRILRGADSRPVQELTPDDSFVCTHKQMGEQAIRMTVASVRPLDLKAGDHLDWLGVRYTLTDEPDYKQAEGVYSYTLTFYAPCHRLGCLLHKDEGSLAFPYDSDLAGHIDALYTSIGREASGFTVGIEEGIETAAEFRHIEFDKTYCLDALTRICEAFGTEWHISGQAIRVGRYKTDPAGLFRYGRGKGLYSLEKIGVSDASVVTRLYGYGSSDNLPAGYRDRNLVFSGVGGASCLEKNTGRYGVREAAVTFDDIYPRLSGATVSAVAVPDDIAKAGSWTVTVELPPDSGDLALAPEQEARIEFTSGALTGEAFAITQFDPTSGQLAFNTSDDNGYKLPSETRRPAVGDRFVLLGIVMPQSYVDRAEAELKARTQEELDRRCEKRYAYRLDIDPRYVRREAIRVRVGDTVLVQESDDTDPVEIRVSEVSYPLQDPGKLSLVLSDTPVYTSYSEKIENDVEEVEGKVEEVRKSGVRFSRRLWRDALQTMEMLRKGLKDYSDSTQPIAVHTMQLLVGDESLQFRFVASRQNPTVVSPVGYNEQAGRLEVASSTLQHLTLGNREITSRKDLSGGLYWDMPFYTSRLFGYEQRDESYYLYARVPRDPASGGGEYRLELDPVEMEQESGYYHLLVGILNSEVDGSRSYTDLYGFTEIAPGRITADRIVSQDGQNFMDFVNNSFRIGNDGSSLEWNTEGHEQQIALNNASINVYNEGSPVVHIDGQNGEGFLAGGTVRWDDKGNFKATSGTFNDVVVSGSFRNAFRSGYYNFKSPDDTSETVIQIGLHDDNNIVIPGTNADGTRFSIPFSDEAKLGVIDRNFNGFRATIINTDFVDNDGKLVSAVGDLVAYAPEGKYFFENGGNYRNLYIVPNEGVEIMGFGTSSDLSGWIVLNRFHVGSRKGSGINYTLTPVLSAGQISAGGSTIYNSWGRYRVIPSDTGTRGIYKLVHHIGHTNYYIFITPVMKSDYKLYVSPLVLEKTADDVTVQLFDTNGSHEPVECTFDFCIIGQY